MITGLQHIGIYCNNLEESIQFYTKVFGFRLVFTKRSLEGDKPLQMAFVRHESGFCIELLEQADKSSMGGTLISPNHIALRTDDADAMAEILKKHHVPFECEPFITRICFNQPLDARDKDVFTKVSQTGVQTKVFFVRGPSNERIEIMADNVGGL